MQRYILPLLAIAISGALPAGAEIDRTQKPAPGPAPAVSFPDYKEKTLENGLKVFVIEDDRKPSITLRLVVKSGSAFDGQETGLASFAAALLNRGTKEKDAAAFAREVDFLGTSLESVAQPDSISVSITGLTKYTDQLLDLFSEAVLHPAFAEDQFKRVQRQALSKLSAEKQQPAVLAQKLSGKVIFGDHPYGAYQTAESVNAITRNDLEAFHQAHFLPNNASLAIVGDVKADAIFPLVEKAFGKWKKKDMQKLHAPAIQDQKSVTVHIVDRPGSVQSNIIITQNGPARNTPDLPELNVLNATLGGGFSGRLFQNLREKHAWTYGAYSSFDLLKLGGSFDANTETRNEVTGAAIGETFKEINRMRDEPIPEAELELQRQYNVGNYLLSLENATRTAQRVQDIDLYGLDPEFYKHYAKRMSDAKADKIQELSKKYLQPEHSAIVAVGEAKEIRPQLEKFGKVYVYDTDLTLIPEPTK